MALKTPSVKELEITEAYNRSRLIIKQLAKSKPKEYKKSEPLNEKQVKDYLISQKYYFVDFKRCVTKNTLMNKQDKLISITSEFFVFWEGAYSHRKGIDVNLPIQKRYLNVLLTNGIDSFKKLGGC